MNISLDALKGMVDEAKVMVVPKTDVEKRIYEAISNKNWGASSTLMNQIAADTYDYEKYGVVMKQVWQSMDGPGRNWRAVFKSLTLLEHLVKNGSERIVEDVRDHMHKIRTLTDFNYYEGSLDRGSGVREKAKALIELLGDNERIRDERDKARRLRDKFVGIGATGGTTGISGGLAGQGGGGGGGSRYDGFSAQDFHRGGDRERERDAGGSFSRGSDRPGRYTDTKGAKSPDSDYGGNRASAYDPAPSRSARGGTYDDDGVTSGGEEEYGHRRGPSGGTTRGKVSKDKIEIRLKKEPSGRGTIVSPPAAKPPTASDLLGDDFFGAGDTNPSGGNGAATGFGADPFDDFNPRGNAAAPPQQRPPQQQHADPFFSPAAPASAGSSPFYSPQALQPPTPPMASGAPGSFNAFAAPAPVPFDPFAAPSPAPAPFSAAPPTPPQANGHTFGFQPQPAPTSSFAMPPQPPKPQPQQPNLFGGPTPQAPAPASTPFGAYVGAPAPAPAPYGYPPQQQQLQQQQQQQHHQPHQQQPLGDFGDFQAGPKTTPAPFAASKPSDPWGGLVNLGNLAEEQPKKELPGSQAAGPSGHDPFSFGDLGSFAKPGKQSPALGAPAQQRPAPTAMGAPMAGYGQPPMGAYSQAAPQNQGYPMGPPSFAGPPQMPPHQPQHQSQQMYAPMGMQAQPRGNPMGQHHQHPPQQAQNPYAAAPQAGYGYPPQQQPQQQAQQPQYGMPPMQAGGYGQQVPQYPPQASNPFSGF